MVTVEVPATAPTHVATASESIILFIRIGVPFSSRRLPFAHAPYKVPIVSNISIMHSESEVVTINSIRELPQALFME